MRKLTVAFMTSDGVSHASVSGWWVATCLAERALERTAHHLDARVGVRPGPAAVSEAVAGVFLRALLASDLVDELRLLVYPVLLGRGKRLFDDRTQASAFRLEESKTSSTGVLVTRYVREGAVRTGTHPSARREG